MAKLEIAGKTVEVDDSFLQLPPEQQQTTVNEIAAQLSAPQPNQAAMAGMPSVDPSMQSDGNSPSPAFQEALAQIRSKAPGSTAMLNGGVQNAPQEDTDRQVRANMEATKLEGLMAPTSFKDASQAAQKSFLGNFGDEAYSGVVGAPMRMLTDGVGYGEGYKRSQALQTEMDRRREKRSPKASLAGNIAGGIGGVASVGPGGLIERGVAALPMVGRNATTAINAARTAAPRSTALASGLADSTALGAMYETGNADPGKRLEAAGHGAKVGLATGLIGEGLARGLRRLITPMPISAERQAMVQTLRNEGVDLTAGQTSGNKTLMYQESELGGGAGSNFMERQGEQFTAAALRRAGINNANRATPDVIDQGFTTLGQRFDDLAARNAVIPDRRMVSDIRNTINHYNQLVPQSQRAPVINDLATDIVTAAQQPGGISGEAYQALSSRVERMARGSSDPQVTNALRDLRGAVDDAMERSIQANNPADAGAWREVRNHYRNMLVIEKAATGAGENAAAGLISPAQLRTAVVGQSRRGYARGNHDLAGLARAGVRMMTPLPNSGTAGRTAARNALMSIPALLGGAGGSVVGGPGLGTVGGMALGAAAPFVAGRALLSAPGRNYLSNQMLGQAGPQLSQQLRPAVTGGLAGVTGLLSGM